MANYEKMSDDEFKVALEAEGFEKNEIEEILSICPTKSNECVRHEKINVKKRKECQKNTEALKHFNSKYINLSGFKDLS